LFRPSTSLLSTPLTTRCSSTTGTACSRVLSGTCIFAPSTKPTTHRRWPKHRDLASRKILPSRDGQCRWQSRNSLRARRTNGGLSLHAARLALQFGLRGTGARNPNAWHLVCTEPTDRALSQGVFLARFVALQRGVCVCTRKTNQPNALPATKRSG